MRGGGQQIVWPACGARACGGVKGGHGNAEAARLAADIVQGGQPVVAIEGRVLDALGHHRRGELLKLHGEGLYPFAERGAAATGDVGGQDCLQEVMDAGIGGRTAFLGDGHGPGNMAAVVDGKLTVGDIAAIDRETGHHFDEGIAQPVEGKVAGVAAGGGNARQPRRQDIQFAGQCC